MSKQYIEELIRKVSSLLDPYERDATYKHLKDVAGRNKLYDDNPECFIDIGLSGDEGSALLLPICNSKGMADPKIIGFSLKLIRQMRNSGKLDPEVYTSVEVKLKRLEKKYSKESPKTNQNSSLKAKSTREINKKITKHLDMIRGKIANDKIS